MSEGSQRPVRRALISVSDKTGLTEFAHTLADLGVTILSTGGTARLLRESGIECTEVSAHTGFPEIMEGRVKTLHPKVHGGILGRRGTDDAVMAKHAIDPIDMVVVNLYPFEETVARQGVTPAEAIEQIDIGGPAMVRAAAKNHRDVTVVVNPEDYPGLAEELRSLEARVSQATRDRLSARAFAHTAHYDGAIANYLSAVDGEADPPAPFPEYLSLQFHKALDMRYGENPHQRAAFYREREARAGSVSSAQQLQGKALSFNNVADTDAAIECVRQFEEPACVIVKHANPCGVAVAQGPLMAYERAYQTDPTSAFGGIIAFNRPLDGDTAFAIIQRQFVEVIVTPHVTPEAERTLAAKSNVRVLETGPLDEPQPPTLDYRRVRGGLLVQDQDDAALTPGDLQVVTRLGPSEQQLADLLFAWRVAKFVKSNAIVYARDGQTVGIGAGQMSRVYSARIAGIKAAEEGIRVAGSVMASDAFFPFRDGIDAANEAGITAVIQPGGSRRDQEVIAAADEHGMAMVFTGIRHFRH